MISGIWTIAKKEGLHIRRDPRSIAMMFLLPLLMMMLYGYAINMDVKNVKIGVIDHDWSPESREVVSRFDGSEFFSVHRYYPSRDEVRKAIESGAIKGALIIPADFSVRIGRGKNPPIQAIIDGSDSNTGKIMQAGMQQILGSVVFGAGNLPVLFTVEPRVWYNPDMEGVNFIVPGLVAVFLMMIATILTSITIAREKETGTMTQLRLSPAGPAQIIIGKVLPYTFLAFMVGSLMLVFALLYYRVPFYGSPWLLAGLSIAFLLASLSIGLLASTVANSQQVAMAGGLLGTMLPSIILSGFIFPIRSMPQVLQWVSTVIPAKYFLEIIRGIMLKDIGIQYLLGQLFALLLFTLIVLAISTIRFRRQMRI
ncbi:MAG: putative multidrug ABC transporter permease YbhR [Candidatus Marinimicrobia bacterium]|nr:putative multidrug ABC transporter permease YbhR [Candidatus Neomarinimicrobiota bacterium]